MKSATLLFVPGWNVLPGVFKPILSFYQNHFNCYLIDLPDSGSYQDTVNHIAALIKEKNLENISIIGWSMGGQIALKASQQIKIKKLVLLSSAAVFSKNLSEKKSFYKLCQSNFQKALNYFTKLNGSLNKNINIQLIKNCENNKAKALKYLKELHSQDLTTTAKNTRIPTLIIHSLDDQIINYSQARELHSLIENSQLIAFKNQGHLIFLNQPKINQQICRFLQT